jgi:serine/threonine-protein kinase
MPSLKPGNKLPGYRIEEFVESGATSEVYRAVALDTGVVVAIKLLHSAWCSVATIRARFENEGRTLLNLRHPNIIRVLSIGSGPDGQPFLALEWVPNDLRKPLQSASTGIAASTALRFAGQLADALCALHSNGRVHRDLKPANILLTSLFLPEAEVKLADLGLAKHLPESPADPSDPLALSRVSTARGTRLGTWEYMAPELWIDAKNANPKSDVYGLGCLLFHLLCGRPLYPVTDEHSLMFHHLFEPPLLNSIGHGTLESLLARMLAKKVEVRPSMADVRRELAMMDVPS